MKTAIILSVVLVVLIYKFKFLRKQYYRLKDVIWLYRATKDLSLITISHYTFLDRAFKIGKNWKKNSLQRNLAAKLVRLIRKESPYKIQKFYKVQRIYDNYFKMSNHILSFEHIARTLQSNQLIYLTQFRTSYPVKGDNLFSSYYLNGWRCSRDSIMLIGQKVVAIQKDKYGEYIVFENGNRMSREEITAYRFSTRKEIRKAKIKKELHQKIEDKISIARKQLENLYEKRSKI